MTPPIHLSLGTGNDQKGLTRTPPSSRCHPWKRVAAAAATAAALVSASLMSGCASKDPIDLLPPSERMVIHYGKPEAPVNESDSLQSNDVTTADSRRAKTAKPLTVHEMLERIRNKEARTKSVQAESQFREAPSNGVPPPHKGTAYASSEAMPVGPRDSIMLRFRTGQAVPDTKQSKLLQEWTAQHGQTPVRISAGPDGDNRQWAAVAKAQQRANQLAALMRAKAIPVTLAYDPRIPINSVRISLQRAYGQQSTLN